MFRKKISFFLVSLLLLSTIAPNVASCSGLDHTDAVQNTSQEKDIYGFKLKGKFQYFNHPVYYYVHEKSGAHLIFEKNNNINKRFEIDFRTPPQNSKGINHIIEHSAMHGGKNHHSYNIFMELDKLSFSSFINAMTLSEFTRFPVESADEDELNSLGKSYAECVFNPKFLTDRSIFEQEGVRFSLDEKGEPQANGTVFNEVRNDDITKRLKQCIFPDTQDSNSHGGDPLDMLDLEYEEVCDIYRKYYHPSNCVIVVSGNLDGERVLKWLSEDYLNKFDKKDFGGAKYLSQYPLKEDKYFVIDRYKADTENQVNSGDVVYVLDKNKIKSIGSGLRLLSAALNDPNSERAKALKGKGYIGVSAGFLEDSFYDPIFSISFSSQDPKLLTQESLNNCISTLFEDYPLSEEELCKYKNGGDFRLKVATATNFYDTNIDPNDIMMSFTRFGCPISDKYFVLSQNNDIYYCEKDSEKQFLKALNEIFVEGKKIFIISNFVSDKKISNEFKIKEKLRNLFQKDSSKFTKNKSLEKTVDEKEDSEKKSKFEKMFKKLSEIETQKLSCPLSCEKVEGKNCYFAPQDVGKYIKYKLAFRVNFLTKEQILYLTLFSKLFSCGDTSFHTRDELENLKSGKMEFDCGLKTSGNLGGDKNVYIVIDVLTDSDNLEKSFEYLREQMFYLKCGDKKLIKDFIREVIAELKSIPKSISEYKKCVAMQDFNVCSYILSKLTPNEQINFLEEIYSDTYSEDFSERLSAKMKKLVDDLINKGTLYAMGSCCHEEKKDSVKEELSKFVSKLIDVPEKNDNNISIDSSKFTRAIFSCDALSNSMVTSVVDLGKYGDDAELGVLCKIVSDYFLSPMIREKNGAYGAAMTKELSDGRVMMISWNDPNLQKTLDIFSHIPEFLKKFDLSQNIIDNACKNIIGSYFQSNKFDLAENQLEYKIFLNSDYCQIINSEIDKIKNTTVEKLKSYIPLLEKALKDQKIIVLSGHLNGEDKKEFDLVCED